MNNIVTRIYFFLKTMCQLAFCAIFGPEFEVSSTDNQKDIVDRDK